MPVFPNSFPFPIQFKGEGEEHEVIKDVEEQKGKEPTADTPGGSAPDKEHQGYSKRQRISLILGLLVFTVLVLIPTPHTFLDAAINLVELDNQLLHESSELGMVRDGKVIDALAFMEWLKEKDLKSYEEINNKATQMKYVAALALLMVIWWMGEAIPLPATALLPLIILPILGVSEMKEVAPSYASTIIFLFMGGFMIAAAMMKWGLHRRLSLIIIKIIGTSSRRIILGFMVATAFLSMWISNTATTMMMMPIALAIILHLSKMGVGSNHSRFGIALMLGIAYAATIGGVSTIIGTPPNAIVVGTLPILFPDAPPITFTDWIVVGVPISWTFLLISWFVLVYLTNPPEIKEIPGGKRVIEEELKKLGPWSKGEKTVLVVFILTALAWINSSPKTIGDIFIPGIKTFLPFVDDKVIAMISAISLFLIPVNLRKGEFALGWDGAKNIPWGILLLFGGGIALSKAFMKSGLANWIGNNFMFLEGMPLIVIIFVIVTLTIFLTEMTSNIAITTLMMPIMASFALAIGEDPRLFMISTAIAASFAFMLPVATPPNAIVFGTGYVTMPQMVRNGFILNLISIFIITLFCYILVPAVFGIEWGVVPIWAKP
ncbi:SLC13 family permease [Methanothermococcus sp. SCGC AD-155-M21]|nr:SLC13 family permease [Methanothermococcus sp. SCGC AD-155-M21]